MPENQRRPSLRSYTSGNTYFYFAVFLGAVILVVSATLNGYVANLRSQIDTLDGQMLTSEQGRNKDQEKQFLAASKQSQILKQLLAGKLYWSQALDNVQQLMQSSVTLTSLNADADKGVISFQGTANSYADVARQIASFVAATGVQDIAVKNIKSTPQGVQFSCDLTIDTKAMLQKQLK